MLLGLAGSADSVGLADLARLVIEQAEASPLDANQREQVADLRAALAFERGDDAGVIAAARGVPADHATRGAPWLLAIVDARQGRTAGALQRLTRLRAGLPKDPAARIGGDISDGIALVALGRWPEAIAQLTNALEVLHTLGATGTPIGEVSTWLGVAQLGAGDVAAAKQSLDVAIDKAWDDAGAAGIVYFCPIAQFALAQALWQLDQDKPRAKQLAVAAREGFKLQGPTRDPERAKVEAWLADK